ncbi:MAG: hypothetical protein GXO78_03475 [Calditrichaeota bacterium]|nr:hypothetical protein [Calditrichota bacterium]
MYRLQRLPDWVKMVWLIGWLFGVQWASAMDIRYEQTADLTRIQLQFPHPTQVKLLNFSPANKIILKLSLDEAAGITFSGLVAGTPPQPPQTSGIVGIRYIPIDNAHGLVIVDLLDKLEFQVRTGSTRIRLEIQDRQYRQPLDNLYWRGVYYQRKGDLKTALQYYRRVVFQNRGHAHAYYKAGQIRLAWKQYRLAEINFNHALRKGCDSTRIYLYMARLYRESGKIQLAQSYEKKYQEVKAQREEAEQAKKKTKSEPPMRIKLVEATSDSLRAAETPAVADSAQLAQGASPPQKRARQRLLVYLILGSVFALFGFSIAVLHGLKRQREKFLVQAAQTRRQVAPKPANQTVNVAARKKQILQMVSQLQDKKEQSESQERDANLQAPGEEPFDLAEKQSHPNPPQEQAAWDEGAGSWSPERQKQLAKELNLGVGEIELALNLSAHHHMVHRNQNYKQQILDLLARNYSIPEIARELQLGQHEVELFLELSAKQA